MVFFTDLANQYAVISQKPTGEGLDCPDYTFWKPLWSHCCKNTSQKTSTMLMRPASTKLWPTDCMHLVLKWLEAQNIWTPKIGWVSCCVPTWQAQINCHHWLLVKLHDPMPWRGKVLVSVTYKLITTTTEMAGWQLLCMNIGYRSGMKDWPGKNATFFFW